MNDLFTKYKYYKSRVFVRFVKFEDLKSIYKSMNVRFFIDTTMIDHNSNRLYRVKTVSMINPLPSPRKNNKNRRV